MIKAFENLEVWFVTGAQLLYGGETVKIVDGHSKDMVDGLNNSGIIPIKVVYKGRFSVGSNDRSLVAGLQVPDGQGVLLIEYETGGSKYRNHYLYGAPPFDFRTYQRLMSKAGIVR